MNVFLHACVFIRGLGIYRSEFLSSLFSCLSAYTTRNKQTTKLPCTGTHSSQSNHCHNRLYLCILFLRVSYIFFHQFIYVCTVYTVQYRYLFKIFVSTWNTLEMYLSSSAILRKPLQSNTRYLRIKLKFCNEKKKNEKLKKNPPTNESTEYRKYLPSTRFIHHTVFIISTGIPCTNTQIATQWRVKQSFLLATEIYLNIWY